MKIIRAMRDLHVPHNPEKPEANSFRAVQKGLVALVPDNFNLPKNYYVDLGKVNLNKPKKKKDD